jgi:hypothetical protein
MSADCRVYLTPEEAASGTTRMIRPRGGDWIEVTIPPTRHDTVVQVPTGPGVVRIHVTVVPPGLSAPDAPVGRRSSWRIGLLVVAALAIVVVLLILRRGY